MRDYGGYYEYGRLQLYNDCVIRVHKNDPGLSINRQVFGNGYTASYLWLPYSTVEEAMAEAWTIIKLYEIEPA